MIECRRRLGFCPKASQERFIPGQSRVKNFDGNPTAYARTIIVRDNISWWRRQREVPSPERADLAAVSSDPETALVVQRSLARLAPRQRAVVVLRHFDDLTEREAAEVLGVTVGTVKSTNAAALARLREGAPELLDLIGGTR